MPAGVATTHNEAQPRGAAPRGRREEKASPSPKAEKLSELARAGERTDGVAAISIWTKLHGAYSQNRNSSSRPPPPRGAPSRQTTLQLASSSATCEREIVPFAHQSRTETVQPAYPPAYPGLPRLGPTFRGRLPLFSSCSAHKQSCSPVTPATEQSSQTLKKPSQQTTEPPRGISGRASFIRSGSHGAVPSVQSDPTRDI